jgi:hypothetical protein
MSRFESRHGAERYVRLVDDGTEDYLYPAEYFVAVEVAAEIARTLEPP